MKLLFPPDYDVGAFGDSRLNGKKFCELEGELQEFKMQFWRYVLSVEYIETDDEDVINNVFDRLNRNGDPLEPQELRNARYYDTELIKMVNNLSEFVDWNSLGKVKVSRMQDAEFVSELVFFLLEREPMDASKRENIDEYYKKWAQKLTQEKSKEIESTFIKTISFMSDLKIDYERYKINGVSHFYALFGFSYKCQIRNCNRQEISLKICDFYKRLRGNDGCCEEVSEYKDSMQSNTRSKGQRIRRINALMKYCGLTDDLLELR